MELKGFSLPECYLRAKDGLCKAIENNPSLSVDELELPWSSIISRESNVCVRFSGVSEDEYVIETKLDLYSGDASRVGWYSQHVDQDGNVIDDFLVFE